MTPLELAKWHDNRARMIHAWYAGQLVQKLENGIWVADPDPTWDYGIDYRLKSEAPEERWYVPGSTKNDGHWFSSLEGAQAWARSTNLPFSIIKHFVEQK